VTEGRPPRRYFEGERPPPEPYAEHVLALWTYDVDIPVGESAVHVVWPDGCVSLSVVSSGGTPVAASIIGPRLRALRVPVRSGQTMHGIRLWPDTASPVLRVDPFAIRDLTRPALDLLGFDALALARSVACARDDAALDAVWEQWLAPRVAAAPLPDPAVRFVVRLLIDSDGTHDLTEAAALAAMPLKRLDQRFLMAVGLGLKQFARVRRVRAATAAIMAGERDIHRLVERSRLPRAASFTREFADVTGLKPVELMRQLDEMEQG
jgi:AraC-like DNA-binding protein